ncbi:MAG: FtsH protease activity modulator HflK [Sphingomonadales bacterium]
MLNEGGPWGGGSSGGSGGGSGDGSGGGGKGNGPRNPWNQPPEGDRPRGNGKGPSALDELLKRARGARGQFPQGDPNIVRWVGYGLVALAGLWIVLTSFHQIQPAERGVVTRLGRYSHTLEPGVSMTLPAPIDRVQTIDVDSIREMQIPGGAGERLVLTRDQNLIDVQYNVRWKIAGPEQYLFQSVEPDTTIKSVAESTMRAALANTTLNDAIGSGRNALATEVQARMQTLLNAYGVGVTIQGIAIRQTDPPAAVVDAFKEVSAAQQKAQTSINQARSYAQQIIQKAQGDAGAFDRVYVQYKAAPEVTRRRMYYETMERVLSKVDKTIVEAPGVTPYLPLRELRRAPADAQGAAQ